MNLVREQKPATLRYYKFPSSYLYHKDSKIAQTTMHSANITILTMHIIHSQFTVTLNLGWLRFRWFRTHPYNNNKKGHFLTFHSHFSLTEEKDINCDQLQTVYSTFTYLAGWILAQPHKCNPSVCGAYRFDISVSTCALCGLCD